MNNKSGSEQEPDMIDQMGEAELRNELREAISRLEDGKRYCFEIHEPAITRLQKLCEEQRVEIDRLKKLKAHKYSLEPLQVKVNDDLRSQLAEQKAQLDNWMVADSKAVAALQSECSRLESQLSTQTERVRRLETAMKWAGGYLCTLTKKAADGSIDGEDCFQRKIITKCPSCTCKEAINQESLGEKHD